MRFDVIETLPAGRHRVLARGLTSDEVHAWRPSGQTWAISFRSQNLPPLPVDMSTTTR